MRNFKNFVGNDSNLPIDRSVSKRVIKRGGYPTRSHGFARNTGLDDTVKAFEEKGIMRWEDANVNYNSPVLTVGIINYDMQETIWMALESLKNQTNIMFSWELIIVEEDSKSRDIITGYIGKLPGCVRILYKGILPGPKLFDCDLLENLNIPEKYTAMEKFVDVIKLASRNSIAFVKQDAHSYSPHNRLYNHYIHFNNIHCLVSTQTNGHLYDIDNDKFMTYDGNNVEPYIWDFRCYSLTGITIRPDYNDNSDIDVRYTHINTAFRMDIIRDIPVFSTPIPEKDLNDVIFSGILAKTGMRPEQHSVVRHDKELDNDGWKSGIHVIKSLSDVHMECIGESSVDNSSHAPEYIIDRLHSLHFHNASNVLLKELSHLQSLKEHEKAKMEQQEREHNDILQHKRELTKVLESRIFEEKRLINSHIEEQERIKKQKQVLEQVSRYRARQEEELLKQHGSLREHLEIEANRIKNDTEIINQRMEELASQKAEEEKLIQEKKRKIDNIKRENKELEKARAKRIIEESQLSKEIDNLEVVTKEDIKQAEKSADEMRKKIKKLEDQQELERQLIIVHEEEYRNLKEQEHNFQVEQKARAEQERIVTEEREKLRVKLEENASRIKQEASDMHIKLKEMHERNVLEKETIAAKKAEKEKVEKEEQELERLLKIRIKQEENLLAAEKEKIGQREKDLVLEKLRHNNQEKNLERQTRMLAKDAERKMNEYHTLVRASEEKNLAHSKINILVRNTYRPQAFKKCISSILSQTNQNFKVIMCYDDERCLEYLEEYRGDNRIEIFKAGNVNRDELAFYNLYCNELLERVTEGWIMFLDDDDMLASKKALDMISDQQFGTNSLIFWKFCRPDMLVYPDIDELAQDTIASSGYCFHSNHKHLSKWKTGQRGDYAFIEGLIKSRHFNRYFIDSVLTKTTFTDMKVGNFGQKEAPTIPLKKFSIIMAYYNRKKQTQLTLDQFERLYGKNYSFEVVIVDDGSKRSEQLDDIINDYSFKIKYIILKNKTWINPVVPMNVAIMNISPDVDVVIFQNPETFHCGNILEHSKEIGDDYLVYPVFNSPSYEMNNRLKFLFDAESDDYYNNFISKINYNRYRGEWDDRVIDVWQGWLQHKQFNDRQLHFLTAISKTNLDKIGGFCNEMKDGLWYDDDEILTRIKMVAKPKSVVSDTLIGVHQKHGGGSNENMKTRRDFDLRRKNQDILTKNHRSNIIYCDPMLRLEYSKNKNVGYLYNKEPTLVYYSKTNYDLLFQRPHQIMRFFDKRYNKVFIGEVSTIKYESNYNLYIVPYSKRNIVFDICSDISIYYTDSRLYDEVVMLKASNVIYDLIDPPIEEFSVWKPNLAKSVEHANIVTYSHPALISFLKSIDVNKEYHYISNACDLDHFSKAKNRIGKRPLDFPKTNKPILGYYGAFAEWLDYDIIRRYADENTYHIVMIGGLRNIPTYNIKFKHANITWLDHKPYNELPYYLSWFDKCFLPFKSCEVTKYVNPCKLWEYMASEKEIIKYNVSIDVDQIVTYKNECFKIKSILEDNFKDIKTVTDFNNKILPLYNDVWIQYYTIPYYTPLFQRPQHVSNNVSKFDFLSIYLEERNATNTEIEYVRHHNVWILRFHYRDFDTSKFSCLDCQKIYISIYSTIGIPFEEYVYGTINKIGKNVSLIYEYIDEIDEKICGSKHSSIIQLKNKDCAFENFDILIGSATRLFNELPKDKKRLFINNGCDIDHYKSKMKKEYTGIEFKDKYNALCRFKNHYDTVLGYFGAIAPWLDYNMINDIIEKRNDIGFVFIGPDYLGQIQNIKPKMNVLMLGVVDYKVLPYFGDKFDSCFIPFADGDIAETTSPLKLYEYFSMRKPVICSKYMLECIQYDEVLSYDSVESFSDCIDKSIPLISDRNYLDRLFNIASENTWSKLCEKIIKQLRQ